MYKLILTAMLLTGIAQAESTKYIALGATQHNTNNNSEIGFTAGFGGDIKTDTNLYFGVNFNLDLSSNFTNYYSDLNVGYAFDKAAIYLIGSALEQTYLKTNAVGFGYGAGLKYQAFNKVAFSIEYKKYSMTSKYREYDYNNLGLFAQYSF